MTPDGIRTFSIDDWTAEEARLIMALWLVQSGAKMSTHFTTPAGEDSLITDPLGIVMVRGPEGVEALTAWVRQRQEGMIVVPAGPAMSAVRSIDDTQQAHDVLWSVVMDGKLAERIGLSAWDKRIAQASLEAMCYVLRHEHGGAFEARLAELEGAIEKAGYRMQEGPPSRRPEDVGMDDVKDGDA